jgi:hypothetical protein
MPFKEATQGRQAPISIRLPWLKHGGLIIQLLIKGKACSTDDGSLRNCLLKAFQRSFKLVLSDGKVIEITMIESLWAFVSY